jgi:uncharacterized integral membrane protein (TIGR00697 family)
MCLLYISVNLNSVDWSPINNEQFKKIFSIYNVGTLASIIAMYIGQIIDITIFAWLKEKTNNKHLWLRNNVSTVIAQFFDTIIVLVILCFFNIIPLSQLSNVFISSFIFKTIAAMVDTPFCYLGHFIVSSIIKDRRK